MAARNVRATEVCKALGINTSVTTGWKQRNTDPPAKYIIPICELLGCSVEYLLTGQEAEKAPVPGFTENGRVMLELFNQLPERDQLLLLGRLQEMVSPISGGEKGAKTSPPSSAERVG